MMTDWSGKPSAKIALSISTRPGKPAVENPTYRGVVLAMEALAHDPSLPVKLDWAMFDDHGDPVASERLARAIVSAPAFVAVVGPMGSTEAFANAPVFNEASLTQISPCASHPDLCRRGFKTFFRLVANDEAQGQEMARVAFWYLGTRRAALVQADNIWATALGDIFTEEYEGLGGKVVGRHGYSRPDEDFSGLIRRIVDATPDLVFFALGDVAPSLSPGLRSAGVRVPFLGTDATKPTFPLGGGEGMGEVYQTYTGADFRRLPSARAFREAYVNRYPEDSTYSPEAYDAVMIIAEAVRRAGEADRGRVLEEVRGMKRYEGVSGLVNFDGNGERIHAPVSLYRVRRADMGLEADYLGLTSELLSPWRAGRG